MKLINGFLKFIGLNAFLTFIILVLLDYEDMSLVFLVVALGSFLALLLLQLYKIYLLNDIKKNKSKNNQ